MKAATGLCISLISVSLLAASSIAWSQAPPRVSGSTDASNIPQRAAAAGSLRRNDCCPVIAAIATSEHPAPGKVHQELREADLQAIFSNRVVIYGGSWSKALAALAHDIDPTGALKIWNGTLPQAETTVALEEGGLTSWLVTGKMLPVARSGNPWRYAANPMQIMDAILKTIARSNKYGEPEFHLRDDLLRLAHALAGDLWDLPLDAAQPGTETGRLKTTSTRRVVFGAIEGVRPRALAALQERARAGNTAFETLMTVGTAQDTLKLDLFDVANAALDVLLSTDDQGKEHGVLSFTRVEAQELTVTLAQVASARPAFGGPAAPNSPQDVIGCKAFAILVTLAASRIEGAEYFRSALLQFFLDAALQIDWTMAGFGQNKLADLRNDMAVTQATLLAAGGSKTREVAERTVEVLLGNAERFVEFVDSWQSTIRQSVIWGPGSTKAMLTLMRSLAVYAPGTGADGLGAVINRRMDDYIAAAGQPGATSPGTREFIDMWGSTKPQWDRKAAGLCPVEGAPPQVALFAKGVFGLILIGRLYQSEWQNVHPIKVPLVVGVLFDEPYDGTEYPVTVNLGGGQLDLSAKAVDQQRMVFLTEEFFVSPR